jgi:PAS domain S-box-containing protein
MAFAAVGSARVSVVTASATNEEMCFMEPPPRPCDPWDDQAYAVTRQGSRAGDVEALSGFDVLITEIDPLFDGRPVAARLRVGRPELPVLFITGWFDHPDFADLDRERIRKRGRPRILFCMVAAQPLPELDLWLVDSLVVPASLHDVSGRFIRVNPAAEQASGHSNAWWLGRHFTEPIPPEAREKVSALFRRAVETGEPTDFETVFNDASGQLRGVRAQHLPLRADGAIVAVLILAFDVTSPATEAAVALDPQLTPRQREILDLIASGHSTSEIARMLTLSRETVRNHVRSVLAAFNVHTRVEALAAARRVGLLAPPALKPPKD